MLLLTKKLTLNYLRIFIYLYVISLCFRIAGYFIDNSFFLVSKSMWILLSATAFVCISTYFLYEFIYTKKYYFYHTIKYGIHSVLGVLTFIFIVFNFLYYLTYVDKFNIYNFFQKFLSLSFYFILTASIFYLFKKFDNKKIAVNSMTILLLTIVVILPLVFTKIFIDKTEFLIIGVGFTNDVRNVYAGLMPLTLVEEQFDYLNLAKISIIINSVLLTLSILGFYLVKNLKINWK